MTALPMRWLRFMAMALAFAMMAASAASADVQRPLLVEGKTTLFQKVITRPGAMIAAEPDAAPGGEVLAPFSVLYVYNKANGRLQVGRTHTGDIIGWLDEAGTIPWAQTIVVSFGNPAGRERVLMFRGLEDVDAVLGAADSAERIRTLTEEAKAGQTGEGRPVVAIEPETYVDIQEQFYFFPILSHQERRLPGRGSGMVLEVASLAKRDAAPAAASREDALKDFNAGIVFVVDTTRSMGPYIGELREAIKELQARIGGSELGDKVRFGLVGFRQNPKRTPNIEYQTKVFLKLDRDATAERFVDAIGNMATAEVSTETFREDALGGVHDALKASDWDAFGARMVVLVSDAGPRLYDAATPEATLAGALGPVEINQMARDRGVEIFVMHVKTPEGASDHESAQADYEKLARSASGGINYLAIEGGDARAYRAMVAALSGSSPGAISAAAQGLLQDAPPADAPADPIAESILAMQLRYLGAAEGQQPPDLFRAWIVDKDLTDPSRQAVDVRVFLSKNQLSTLRQIGQVVIDKANGTIPNPGDFFAQLRTAMALLARNPELVVDAEADTLGDALGEYLEDLPYRSDVLGISQEDWDRMGGGAQRALIDGLQRKLAFYDDWHNTPANWTAPYDGAPDGEYVSALPLAQMP